MRRCHNIGSWSIGQVGGPRRVEYHEVGARAYAEVSDVIAT
jgi:hypothetical protein